MNLKIVLQRTKIYSCNICNKGYLNVVDYMKHIYGHVNDTYVKLEKRKIYRCKLCSAGFFSGTDCKLHQLVHIRQNVRQKHIQNRQDQEHYSNSKIIRKFKCAECDRMFTHEDTLKAHSVIHEPFPYICFCGIGYYSKIDFEGHQSVVHKDTKAIKSNNTKDTEPKVIFKEDLYEENNDNIIEPEDCKDDDYGKKKKKHVLKIKLKESVNKKTKKCKTIHVYVNCSVCEKKLMSKNLDWHMKSFHSEGRDAYKCRYCGKQFKNNYNTTLHERTHTGEKPLSCKFCSKPFSDPSALLRHVRTHTKEYKYFCTDCPKKFTDKSGLITHRLRHEEKKVVCDICDKKFYTKGDLEKHFKIHIAHKNYECDNCGKRFLLKSYLLIHIKSCENFRKVKQKKKIKNKKLI